MNKYIEILDLLVMGDVKIARSHLGMSRMAIRQITRISEQCTILAHYHYKLLI